MIVKTNNGQWIICDMIESLDTEAGQVHMVSGRQHTVDHNTMSEIASYFSNKEKNQTHMSY